MRKFICLTIFLVSLLMGCQTDSDYYPPDDVTIEMISSLSEAEDATTKINSPSPSAESIDEIMEAFKETSKEISKETSEEISEEISEEVSDIYLETQEDVDVDFDLPIQEIAEHTVSSEAQPLITVLHPQKKVAIDPGHQARGNSNQEPDGPGSSTLKAKVTSGTKGVATGVYEYELVLDVSLLLRDELIARGYEVFMTRESHDVDVSNVTRAQMATEAGADVFVRIHANGSENQSVNGIMTVSHTANNPYIPNLYEQSRALSDAILKEMLTATGANSKGVWETDTMSGSNWATMPVTIVEMGYMSNVEEDKLMQTLDYQIKLVEGMANGIEVYFHLK